MTVADLAIIAGLVFVWGTLSARLERLDMTAPIVFTVAGVLLTQPLRSPAHPATRRRRPGRAGRDTRTTPHPQRPACRPARRGRKSLMTTNQVLPGADPVDGSECRPGCPRAGRSAATGGRRRLAALPPGRVQER